MKPRNDIGGVVHVYQKYNPIEFPSPSSESPDLVSGAFEHALAYGSYRELTEEELARAIELDPSQIAGLGPSIDAKPTKVTGSIKKPIQGSKNFHDASGPRPS